MFTYRRLLRVLACFLLIGDRRMNRLPTKRSPSPISRHFDHIIKLRLSDSKEKSDSKAPLAPETLRAQRGQEILSLPSSLHHDSKHENINDLIIETTLRLAKEGKRILRAPRLQ